MVNDVDDILHGPHQADHDDDLGVAWRVRLGQTLEMSSAIFEGGNFLRSSLSLWLWKLAIKNLAWWFVVNLEESCERLKFIYRCDSISGLLL